MFTPPKFALKEFDCVKIMISKVYSCLIVGKQKNPIAFNNEKKAHKLTCIKNEEKAEVSLRQKQIVATVRGASFCTDPEKASQKMSDRSGEWKYSVLGPRKHTEVQQVDDGVDQGAIVRTVQERTIIGVPAALLENPDADEIDRIVAEFSTRFDQQQVEENAPTPPAVAVDVEEREKRASGSIPQRYDAPQQVYFRIVLRSNLLFM